MIFFLFLEIFFLLVSGQRGKFCGGVLRVLLCIFFDLFFLCRSGRAVLIDFNRYCATQLMIGKFRKSADMYFHHIFVTFVPYFHHICIIFFTLFVPYFYHICTIFSPHFRHICTIISADFRN